MLPQAKKRCSMRSLSYCEVGYCNKRSETIVGGKRMSAKLERIDYPELLRALGHFIQREHLSEVSIIEFDRGWVIAGLTFKSTAQGFIRVPADFVISHDEVRKMIQELQDQRQRDAQTKRGWRG